ncbi:hypothetical protein [Candidatus Frankia alpina]|uniref:hypothetical protein n=1 Tax=Candidatus Frankia alpina TaxID=2699483 RepID=UPI001966EACD|nr:hypothetical protein [Candidatus Frankia alpina]
MIPTRLTPTRRAAVMVRLCYELGSGRPATRADIVREMFGAPTVAISGISPTDVAVTLASPVFVAPAAPDHQGDDVVSRDAPVDQAPDSVVSFADAAARLGLSIGTVRRYCAPSSGKLRRVGTGVSLASVEALAA